MREPRHILHRLVAKPVFKGASHRQVVSQKESLESEAAQANKPTVESAVEQTPSVHDVLRRGASLLSEINQSTTLLDS